MTSTDHTNMQKLLDVIGDKPGSILVRGPERWIALAPGDFGDVLVINDGGFPEWVPPGTVQFGN